MERSKGIEERSGVARSEAIRDRKLPARDGHACDESRRDERAPDRSYDVRSARSLNARITVVVRRAGCSSDPGGRDKAVTHNDRLAIAPQNQREGEVDQAA